MPTINISGQPAQGGPQGGPSQGYYSNAFQQAQQRHADAVSQLEKRGNDPLTPSKFASFDRSIDKLESTIRRFESKFNQSAGLDSRISNLRQGMGSPEAAYRVGNTLRLGNRGQRFAEDRSYTSLAGVQHELRRIESLIDKQSRFASSPAAQASLHRQKDSLYISKQRIQAGLSGNSSIVNSVGGAIGGLGLVLGNPVFKAAASVAVAAATAPYTANKAYAGVLGLGKEYRDFAIGTRRAGLAGGYSGSDLENLTLNQGAASYIPGGALPAELRQFGLAPQDVQRLGSAYGVPATSARRQVDIAESIRMASVSPTLSAIPEQELAAGAGQAKVLANMTPDKYFEALQKVTGTAVLQGLDSSRMSASFNSLLSQAGKTGLSVGVGGLSDWFARQEMSPVPSFRSGEGEATYLGGLNKTLGGLGSDSSMAANVTAQRFFNRVGQPKNEQDLQRKLGFNDDQWAQVTSGGGQAAVNGLMSAVKKGDAVGEQVWLGQLLQNQPDAWDRVIKGSGMGGLDANLGPRIRANISGVPLGTQVGHDMSAASGGMPPSSTAPSVPPELFAKIAKRATELGIPVQAALGVIAKESGFNVFARAKGGSSATGLGQVTTGTAASLGYSQDDMLVPDKAIDASLRYYKQQLDASGGDTQKAYERYHWGPASGKFDSADAQQFSSLSNQYKPMAEALGLMGPNADQQASGIKASQYADTSVKLISDSVQAAFTGATAAVEGLSHAADAATASLARLAARNQISVAIPKASPATGNYGFDIPNDSSGRVNK